MVGGDGPRVITQVDGAALEARADPWELFTAVPTDPDLSYRVRLGPVTELMLLSSAEWR